MKAIEILTRLDACEEAKRSVGDLSLREAWEQCQRGDWMLWLAARAQHADGDDLHRQIVRCAALCSMMLHKNISDPDLRAAVDRVCADLLAWSQGNAVDLGAVLSAAESAVRSVAWSPASAARLAASAARLAASAASAARLAASAATAASAASAAWSAARSATCAETARIVRENLDFELLAQRLEGK